MNRALEVGLRGRKVDDALAEVDAPARDRVERPRAPRASHGSPCPRYVSNRTASRWRSPWGARSWRPPAQTDAQVGSACGGVCACSTCHVYVKEGLQQLSSVSDREEDIMDKAFDVRPTSRLGCQAKMLAERTYVVEISPESRKAFLDEHPEIRNALAQAQAAGRAAP